MIFFKKNSYFSLFLKDVSCEICIKFFDKKKSDICKNLDFYDFEQLKKNINVEISGIKKNKKILVCDFWEQFCKIEDDKNKYFVDEFGGKKFYISKTKIENFEQKLNLKFDQIHSSFTLLNELSKTKQNEKTTLFVLPFANSICYMLKQDNVILFAKILEINNDFMCMLNDPKFENLPFDKFEDIVFMNLLYGILQIFDNNLKLTDQICIFNDEILNEGAVYLLYTKTLIQTELIPLKISERICEIFSKDK